MSCRKADIVELDTWFPPAGPCAFCGHRDRRHRIWDVIMERQRGGESAEDTAEDFELPVEVVDAVLRVRPYRRK